jgi:hypothetical protein
VFETGFFARGHLGEMCRHRFEKTHDTAGRVYAKVPVSSDETTQLGRTASNLRAVASIGRWARRPRQKIPAPRLVLRIAGIPWSMVCKTTGFLSCADFPDAPPCGRHVSLAADAASMVPARRPTDWAGLIGEAACGIWKKTSFATRLPKAVVCLDTKNPLPGRWWVRKLRLS